MAKSVGKLPKMYNPLPLLHNASAMQINGQTYPYLQSLHQSRHQARSHRPTALTDIEPLPRLDGKRVVQLTGHLNVVARHGHFGVLVCDVVGPVKSSGFVCRLVSYQWPIAQLAY